MVRVGGNRMKHYSCSRGVILCTTGIEMVPKANTTLSQIQQSCAIAAHASQICVTRNYRKGLMKRSDKKRKKHHKSLHHVLSPPYLNFISPVDLTGYTIFSHGGAIDNPPINILNLPTSPLSHIRDCIVLGSRTYDAIHSIDYISSTSRVIFSHSGPS